MRGPQAGLSTFIFSYKEKIFQGNFSEQEAPPKQEGSCSEDAVGIQTAQSCCSQVPPLCPKDRSTPRAAQLLPLGQPSTAGLGLLSRNRCPVGAMCVSHRKQRVLTKGSSSLGSPSRDPCWHTCSERCCISAPGSI